MTTKATNEQIISAYKETGSVWRAAAQLGMCGQSVHERLRRLGHQLSTPKWSEEEVAELRRLVGSCTIGEIASRLGRPYGGTAAKISELGIGTRYGNNRPVKLPRGAGLDKASIKGLVKALQSYDGTLSSFCRAHGLSVELFVQAIQKHYPEQWELYTAEHAVAPPTPCPYCGRYFYPMSGKQKNCSRQCATDARRDAQYFGGKRRNTIGLAEGVCQLCRREGRKGLSSHHIFGKANDPDNECLVALCQGCHNLVEMLASRKFLDDNQALEALIGLAVARRNGADKDYRGSLVYVDVEPLEEED